MFAGRRRALHSRHALSRRERHAAGEQVCACAAVCTPPLMAGECTLPAGGTCGGVQGVWRLASAMATRVMQHARQSHALHHAPARTCRARRGPPLCVITADSCGAPAGVRWQHARVRAEAPPASSPWRCAHAQAPGACLSRQRGASGPCSVGPEARRPADVVLASGPPIALLFPALSLAC